VEYNEIKSKPVGEIAGFLKNHGKPIKEMTIFDFIENNGVALNSVNGIYIFRNHDSFYYIGKCSSRAFVERIPSHFDTREGGWFNTLLKYLCEYKHADSCFDAAMFAKNNLFLILIQIQVSDLKNYSTICSGVEKLLRLLLQPKLNSYKNKMQETFNQNHELDNLPFEEAIKKIRA